jgi:hypothetical protein
MQLSKKLLIMKKRILSIITLLALSTGVNSQTWETIGSEGFTSGGTQYGCMDVYNGTPYIAYKDVANGSKCTVMRYNGTNWVYVGSQGFTPGISREQSIAIDQQNGDVYIEYTDATVNAIIVSKFNDNSGIWEPLGQNGVASTPSEFYQQIKIDNGIPFLVFGGYQATLKQYNPGNPTGTWTATPGPVISMQQAWYTRMAIDGTTKYVVYSDMSAQGKASVAKAEPSSISAVGGALGFTSGGVGFTDISLDNGMPYISFQDSVNGRKISVMKFNGTTWEYVGSAGISGGSVEQTRILIHNAIPYISYRDENDGNIHVKKFDGNNWVSVGAAIANGQVYLNDMIINDDHVFISYKDVENFSGKMTVKKFNLNATSGLTVDETAVVTLYPNPAQNYLNFDLNTGVINKVSITDFTGKILQTITENIGNKIDIFGLSKGIYFLNITTDSGVATQRFVKE